MPSVNASALLQQPVDPQLGGGLRQRIRHSLRRWWRGRGPRVVPYDWFSPEEVQRLHSALVAALPEAPEVMDDATWRDLQVSGYLAALARHTSLFGRQMLFHRLRGSTLLAPEERLYSRLHSRLQVRLSQADIDTDAGPGLGPDIGRATGADVGADVAPDVAPDVWPDDGRALDLDLDLDAAWAALQPLRSVDIDLAGLLFADSLPIAPAWVRYLWAVPVTLALAAGLAVLGHVAAGAVLGVATLAVSAWAQIVLHGPLLQWQRQRQGLQVVLRAALDSAAVAAVGVAGVAGVATAASPLLQGVRARAGLARGLMRALKPGWVDRIPALAEYANLLALTQYRRWGRELARLPAQRADLQQVFLAVAGLEADLTLRGHLRHGPATCPALPAAGRSLAFTNLVHPLLTEPHPLSLQLNGQGAFITGQNGAGKSTLLRSVGLNVVVGQAFGFCYARQATVPRVPVCSSLQIEDSLGTATSLYMAELGRARDLCRVARLPGGALLLVDEIFRGTNPQESMAATAALALELTRELTYESARESVRKLAGELAGEFARESARELASEQAGDSSSGALLLMATHHCTLAPWLAPVLEPWCVALGEGGAQTLQPGVLERTNGLAMLADYGFSAAMRADAQQVFDGLQASAGLAWPPTGP